jgi:hypothetical protein
MRPRVRLQLEAELAKFDFTLPNPGRWSWSATIGGCWRPPGVQSDGTAPWSSEWKLAETICLTRLGGTTGWTIHRVSLYGHPEFTHGGAVPTNLRDASRSRTAALTTKLIGLNAALG